MALARAGGRAGGPARHGDRSDQAPAGAAALGRDEATVYDFSCELQTNRAVSDETYDKALALLGPAGVVELTALNGYYAMIAMTLNEHRIPLPGGAPPQLPT